MTVPGVGIITALTFKAEIDDPSRFKRSRDVGVHLGLTPRKYASGEVDRSGGISKCGNGALRSLLFEASVTMLTREQEVEPPQGMGRQAGSAQWLQGGRYCRGPQAGGRLHRMWIDETNFAYGDVPAIAAA